jgi:hypothetical protein
MFFEPNLNVLHRRYSADVELQTELFTQYVCTRYISVPNLIACL